jgi:peptide/nickel transport system permease protein
MSAISTPVAPGPDAVIDVPEAVVSKRFGMLRALPRKAKVGGAILAVFILVAVIGPSIAPYDPSATTAGQALPIGPTSSHLLGTTATGQDVLSQLLVGIRSTVVLGLLTGLIATTLSVVIGTASGFLGGLADDGLSLLANVFLVLPALPLLVVILGYLPHSGEVPVAIVLSVLAWPWGARVIRAQTLSLRNRDYVAAAREVGESTPRIIVFEILPNELGLIAAGFVSTVLYAILTSVALAFLGVTNLSSWSLGTMLYWAQNGNAVQLNAWWWYAPPGVCVAVLGMSLVLLNFGLDEFGNPRLRSAAKAVRIGRRGWRPTDPTPVVSDQRDEAPVVSDQGDEER